jgi:hypothetical protein
MDVKFNKELNTPVDTSISKVREEFSIDALLEKVKEFHRRQQLDLLERLTMENSLLQKQIVRYQDSSSLTINLLKEAYSVVALMQDALERCRLKELAADKDWLAYWGVREGSTDGSGYYPADWI